MTDAAIQSLLKYADLLLRKGMHEEARARLQDVLRQDPACARAHYTLAAIHASEGRPEEAAGHFQETLRLVPDDVKALNGLGIALQQMGRVMDAGLCYRQAVRIDPRYQDARINLATLLKEHGMLSDAERCLIEAVRLDPGSVRLAYNLANIVHSQGRSLEAVAAYRETLRLDPEHLDAQQNLLFALHYSSRFSDEEIFQEHLAAGRKRMFQPEGVSARGSALPGANDMEDGGARQEWRAYADAGPIRRSALPGANHAAGSGSPPEWRSHAAPGRRIRIGYVSPDFRDHSVARFIEPILANHDKTRFEIFCYANVGRADRTTERLMGLAEHWRDIRAITDEKAAFIIANDGIEILIDLAGHTAGNRLPLFARRPAPLQVTWIGYPDTTGLPQMDYRITDLLADPPGREAFHTERLIRLPRTFSCYQPAPGSPEVAPLPADLTGRITFGSFNNLAKVTPEVIALWARVLQAVPASRLLLKCRPLTDQEVADRIRERFARGGVDPGRVELHGGNPSISDHLAHYANVDISLDTFPYNGTTTTCEALWMGVPVVTLAGTRHASRTGATILTNCGLRDFISADEDGYVALARELAGDRSVLRALRGGLRKRMQASPLMDGVGVTRELEGALMGIIGEQP